MNDMLSAEFSRKISGKFGGINVEVKNYQPLGISANALVITLPHRIPVLSTRQGFRTVKIIANFYMPKSLTEYVGDYNRDLEDRYYEIFNTICQEYHCQLDDIAYVTTGVNMENIAWAEESHQGLWALVFSTAGVKNNALRIGVDSASGTYIENQFARFGTINNIVITNASFDQAGMASAIIVVTEAKNVALQELDVRSSFNHELLATGTGTDQIIIAPNRGDECSFVQGHTKIGEMMAKAVTRSTIEAIQKSTNHE